jgi:hypothetical protein
MKTTIFSTLLILSFVIPLRIAFSADQGQAPYTREDLENHRQEIVVRNMDLNDADKAKFLEIYVPYQEKLMQINRSFHKLQTALLNAQNKKLSNDQAKQLLAAALKWRTARLENLDNYTSRLKSILSPTKVYRAYQIEDKLFSAAGWVYTQDVPLAEE